MNLYLVPFMKVDRKLALSETRVINLQAPELGVPPGSYAIMESYCADPHCDCRRVMLTVIEERRPTTPLATISYAFDRDNPDAGPFLDPLNAQSPYAEALMELVYYAVLSDALYLARLERHYAMTKAAAADPTHPAYAALRESFTDDPDEYLEPLDAETEAALPFSEFKRLLSRPRVGRNDPCPCGSGKKYKVCCGRKS
ncbi:MAG: SEC-C metal-binding domain-containing protein [Anaerolineae bacterium]|jgi:hypothetical protein|nr:SEC-C metal-binding domain-containing protein [Anaerolineae bacterium]